MEQRRRAGTRAATSVVLALCLAACGSGPAEDVGRRAPSPTPATSSASPAAPATRSPSPTPAEGSEQGVAGTVVHFTAGDVVVEAVLHEDNPTTRSLLAMLPMTLEFSDYGGQEKVASPPGEFDYTDAEGMTPEAGDLFSYRPWGNLGFFYDAEDAAYSDSLTRIGTTDDVDQIELLDGQAVTIEVVG